MSHLPFLCNNAVEAEDATFDAWFDSRVPEDLKGMYYVRETKLEDCLVRAIKLDEYDARLRDYLD